MKRVMSIILCLTMLFVMASVPALAAEGEGTPVEILKEDFGSYKEGDSFDVAEADAIKYPNAQAYIYSPASPSSNVTLAVNAYEGNNALKIGKLGEGDKRILFKLNNACSGQVEISFRMLTTEFISGAMNVEVFDATNSTVITGTKITLNSGKTRFTTYYNGTEITKVNNVSSAENNLTAGTWLDVNYSINTANGDVVATYKYGDKPTVIRTIDSQDTAHVNSLSAVSGLCVRLQSAAVCDLYVDDISVKYYEQPAAAESEFDFSEIANGNESESAVTKALDLVSIYTDSEDVDWNITWSSSDETVVNSETGAVNPAGEDKEVTLTATFTNVEATKTFTKTFTVTVPALLSEFDFSDISSESINGVTSTLNLINKFTDNAGREWDIRWNSEDENVINSQTGAVTAGGIDERVALTANLTCVAGGEEGELTLSRTFNVKVLAAGAYQIKDSFDFPASLDCTIPNGIINYKGDGTVTWGIAADYMGDDLSKHTDMNANISSDPENSADKVLKLHRSVSASQPSVQRVWTAMNNNASALNDKVYVGMRVLRENIFTSTDIYAYNTDGDRLMYIKLNANNQLRSYYWNGTTFDDHGNSNAFPANEWFDITLEFDMKNGTYSVYVDGVAKRTGLAMAEKGSFGGLMFDIPRSGYTGVTTTYIDDITVRTTDGFPYSIVEYNFTDAEDYPAKSMVEGGFLESVTMRKMSTVDSEAEPTLYVGFFKDEKLYDVVSAPLSEYSALGGFEVVLNKELPANPLDYEVKTFVFSKDLVPLMNTSEYVPFEIIPTIFAAGDSIARNYSATEYPMSGYIQELGAFFEEETINIENYAISGRSSKSFIEEGSLDKILNKIYSGDYLFIQFGHNDDKPEEYRKTDPDGDKNTEGSYKYYLMQYINGARDRGATPVLITPPSRNSFDSEGKMKDSALLKYVTAMRDLAEEESVQIVDLYKGWAEFVDGEVLNGIDSRNFYSYFYADDQRFVGDTAYEVSKYNVDSGHSTFNELYPYYFDDDPTSIVHHDGTHLNAYGAKVAAKIVADSLATSGLDLAGNIVENREVKWPWGEYATFGTELTKRN